MMYKNQFIVVIKSNNQILREQGDVITLPFGSEYTILCKNLDSRKVEVSITVDGRDIMDNKKLVIDGNNEVELEGYIDGFVAKNRFKFIQKTKEITNHRGDRIDDGIIRIEFQYEKKVVTQRVEVEYMSSYHYPRTIYTYNSSTYNNDGFMGFCDTGSMSCSMSKKLRSSPKNINHAFSSNSMEFMDHQDNIVNKPLEDEGITVKGSQCNQRFREVFIGELEEQSSVIVLKLRGYNSSQEKVTKPITVKTILKCETCGKPSRSNAKFCSNCGTSLV